MQQDIIARIKEMSENCGRLCESNNDIFKVLFVTTQSHDLVYNCLSISTGEKTLLRPEAIKF